MSDTTEVTPPGPLGPLIELLVVTPPRDEVEQILAGADQWAVSLDVAAVLDGLVTALRPPSVLEFGAGRSSLVLAAALRRCGGGRLTSIEHEPAWARAAWDRTREYEGVDAALIHAGLAPRFGRHGRLNAYTGIRDALRSRGPFALVFVDGPPGRYGRDATVFDAAPYLAPNAVLVLDDAARAAEKTAVRRWERALAIERVFESDTVGRGMSVLRIVRPGVAAFSWRTFAGTIHDRIRELREARKAGGA